jgi:hypothetical protein
MTAQLSSSNTGGRPVETNALCFSKRKKVAVKSGLASGDVRNNTDLATTTIMKLAATGAMAMINEAFRNRIPQNRHR